MSFDLTSEKLQGIAVGCVLQFMNKQASLSEAIAKQAQTLELNSDQTKRVIEASNTIAYLRQLEKSADRTFEFEVADYDKVMGSMCVPESVEKQASSPIVSSLITKEASFTEASPAESAQGSQVSEERILQEKRAMLTKEFYKAKGTLTKIAYDKIEMQLALASAVKSLRADVEGMHKLACVVQGSDLDKTLALCGLEKSASASPVFKDRDLRSSREVVGLYKKALALVEETSALESFIKRADEVLFPKTANVIKLAGLGTMAGNAAGYILGGAARGLATATGGAIVGAAKGIRNVIGNPGSFGRAAKAKGFNNTEEAVKNFDMLSAKSGRAGATHAYGGAKPSFLIHRVGVGGAAIGLAGMSIDHTNNVKDII